MPHLVSSMVSEKFRHLEPSEDGIEDIPKTLAEIFLALGTQYIRQFTQPLPAASGDWQALAKLISPSKVTIEELAPLIAAGEWDRVELLNQLRHIEVLLEAMNALEGFQFHYCAPTQQSDIGKAGMRLADLEGLDPNGDDFALEAYGGYDYANNKKAGKDIRSLRTRGAARSFMAARPDAWRMNWLSEKQRQIVNDNEHADVVREFGGYVVEIKARL